MGAEQFSSGELVYGRVVGINKTKRGKYIELSLIDEEVLVLVLSLIT